MAGLLWPAHFLEWILTWERFWRDVHASLITYARDQLQERLPADLIARIEERVYVEMPEGPGRSIYPDVRVVERASAPPVTPAALSGIAVAEPEIVHVPKDEPVTETCLEILEAGSGHRVVTAIEFLSPSNKISGPGQDLYLQKEKDLRGGGVNLVEIDLVRSGKRILGGSASAVPNPEQTAYIACVRRGWQPARLKVYRLSLRQRLPVLSIPLRQTDQDVPLDLQPLVDQAYRAGRYELELDYRQAPEQPLQPEDAAWADELLRSQGRR
jgi:Protein of unknown function (DUF4058)